jgi:hypothetical protein
MPKKKLGSTVNILFIGNSFTQRNDLPGLLAEMAAERGVHIQHKLISAGGASLRNHWNAGRAVEAIKDGEYDYVVLQEQSTLPVKNAKRMTENVRLFDEVIKQAGAKTVLYMTWARQHSPESQRAITDAYSSIGKELGAIVMPVGLVWQKFISKHDQPLLYDRDQSHPSPAGTYLATCVFLVSLLKIDPRGIEACGAQFEDHALPAATPITAECPRGGAVIMTNLTPHCSTWNYSDQIRWSVDLRFQQVSSPNNLSLLPPSGLPEIGVAEREADQVACYPPEADLLVSSAVRPEAVIDLAEFRHRRAAFERATGLPRPRRNWPRVGQL